MPNPLAIVGSSRHSVAIPDSNAFGPIAIQPKNPGWIAKSLQTWAVEKAQNDIFRNRVAAFRTVKSAQQDAVRDEVKAIVVAGAKLHGAQVLADMAGVGATVLAKHQVALLAEKRAITTKLGALRYDVAVENFTMHNQRRDEITQQCKEGRLTDDDAKHLLEIVGVLRGQVETEVDESYETGLGEVSSACRVATETATEIMKSFRSEPR